MGCPFFSSLLFLFLKEKEAKRKIYIG